MITNPMTMMNYIDRGTFFWTMFADYLVTEDLHRMYTASWDTNLEGDDWARISVLEEGTKTLYINYSGRTVELFAEVKPGVFAYFTINKGGNSLHITIAVQKEQDIQAAEVLGWLQTVYPRVELNDPSAIRMKFWMNSPTGAQGITRTIKVPIWEDIQTNYSQETKQELTGVMREFTPAHGGQLLLWHGKPGTGKTFALRSLGLYWREWCTVQCVIDPEAFFGNAYYMMSVLMDGQYEQPNVDSSSGQQPQWRLLILEDAGELLAEDARDRTGQGLSRLLNLADGLIGQGLQTLILVTTNEPLKKLHPAVARPGRCASEIEFKAFTPEEANTWLTDRKIEVSAKGPQTLAQLYSQTDGFEVAQGAELQKLGFKAG